MTLKTIAQVFMDYVPRKLGFLEEYSFSLSEACLKRGIKPIFVFPDTPADFVLARFNEVGAHVVVIHFRSRATPVSPLAELLRLVRRKNIELVDFHFGDDVRIGLLGSWLRLFNRKVVIIRHQHNTYAERKYLGFVQKRISRLKLACLLTHKVIAVSEAVKGDLRSHGVPEEKIVVVHNGINVTRYQPSKESGKRIRNEFGFSDDVSVITAIAYACPMKGLEYLVQAIPAVLEEKPSTKFLVVGGGPLTETLRDQARRLGIGRDVVFTGIRKDVPDILSATDISVLPSISSEGLPVAVLESMWCEKPMVASDLQAISEMVKHDETGILVPPRDSASLAKAIIGLLTNSELARQMGEKGRRVVEEEFTDEKMIAETFGVYERSVADN